MQHDRLRCRRLGDLIAEHEVHPNRCELGELNPQLFRSQAISALLLAQQIAGPFRADGSQFHGFWSATRPTAVEPTAIGLAAKESTTPVAAAAAAATAAARFVLRLIHLQRAAAEVFAIERLHRFLRVGARHLHEPEAARLARVAIVDESDLFNRAMGGEQLTHAVFRGTEGQISNVKFSQEKILGNNNNVDSRRNCAAPLCE
jgi:hypothetical protein